MSPNGQTGASLDSELNGTVESSDGYDELKCRAPRLIAGLGSMVVACSMLTSLSRQRFLARSRLSAQPHALLTPTHTYNYPGCPFSPLGTPPIQAVSGQDSDCRVLLYVLVSACSRDCQNNLAAAFDQDGRSHRSQLAR